MKVPSLGWEDLLGEGMAIHSIIVTWRIPWTQEPGGLPHGQTLLKWLSMHICEISRLGVFVETEQRLLVSRE